MQRSLIIGLVLAILLVIFALQNAQEVIITLYFWKFQSSLALLLLISLAIGVFLGAIFSVPSITKRNKKIEELKIKLDDFRETQRQKVEKEDKDVNTELEG